MIKTNTKLFALGCLCVYGVPGCNDPTSKYYEYSWLTLGCPIHYYKEKKDD